MLADTGANIAIQRRCNRFTPIVLFVFQSIQREQFCSKQEWQCEDPKSLYETSDPFCDPLRLQIEIYLSGNFTTKMEDCINADDKRKEREKVLYRIKTL